MDFHVGARGLPHDSTMTQPKPCRCWWLWWPPGPPAFRGLRVGLHHAAGPFELLLLAPWRNRSVATVVDGSPTGFAQEATDHGWGFPSS